MTDARTFNLGGGDKQEKVICIFNMSSFLKSGALNCSFSITTLQNKEVNIGWELKQTGFNVSLHGMTDVKAPLRSV